MWGPRGGRRVSQSAACLGPGLLCESMGEAKCEALRGLLMSPHPMHLETIFVFAAVFLCKFQLISCFNEDVL